MSLIIVNVCFVFVLFVNLTEKCDAFDSTDVSYEKNGVKFIGRMLDQGRTLVHHAVKRFMIILPAIFFKLGIAFTLLILVTIVAINNGFIGFLLLVVGLSSVLARLQEARRTSAAAYIAPLPTHYHQAQILNRRDDGVAKSTAEDSVQSSPSYQYYSNSRPYPGYNQVYYGSKPAK